MGSPKVVNFREKDLEIKELIARGGFSTVNRAILRQQFPGAERIDAVAVKTVLLYTPSCFCVPFFFSTPMASTFLSGQFRSGSTRSTHMLKQEKVQGMMTPSEAVQEASLLEEMREDPFFLTFYGSYFTELGKKFCVVTEMCICSVRSLLINSNLLHKEGRINRFPFSIAWHLTLPILEGLAHMHKKGIIHRDIKEENILLTVNGVPKICDLGLAVHFDTHKLPINLHSEHEIGTNWYMAPEIVRKHQFNQSVDTWSCGMMLLSMLRGGNPFETDIGDVIQLWDPNVVHFYKYQYFVHEAKTPGSGQVAFFKMARLDKNSVENTNGYAENSLRSVSSKSSSNASSRQSHGNEKMWKLVKSFLRQLLIVTYEERPIPEKMFKLKENWFLKQYIELWHVYMKQGNVKTDLDRSEDLLGKFRKQFDKTSRYMQKLIVEHMNLSRVY